MIYLSRKENSALDTVVTWKMWSLDSRLKIRHCSNLLLSSFSNALRLFVTLIPGTINQFIPTSSILAQFVAASFQGMLIFSCQTLKNNKVKKIQTILRVWRTDSSHSYIKLSCSVCGALFSRKLQENINNIMSKRPTYSCQLSGDGRTD